MTRILAVVDPEEELLSAVERCTELPANSDLDIHVALFIANEDAQTFKKTFTERSAWLKKAVTKYVADGYRITTEVVPFTRLYESVLETARKFNADFVFKPMRQHSLFSTAIRTSTDWNLIRNCPLPLLLVSHETSVKHKPVIAALDVCSGEERHEVLNKIVLEQARTVADVIGSAISVVNAFRMVTPMMAVGAIDPTPYPTPADLLREHLEEARMLGAPYKVARENVYVEEGSAAYTINHRAKELGAGIIVIGTVARKGIGGAVIGNTAESVLEGSPVDVLVVKLPVNI